MGTTDHLAHDLRVLDVPRSWSEVTPGWMTGALARDFPGAVVSELLADDITEGTNNRARIRLRYRSGNGPETVVVKREGSVMNRLALLALGAVQNEARFLASGAPLPIEHPAPYAVATDRRRLAAVVVMEDVTSRAGRPNDLTVELSVGEVHNGLEGLARLHAAYWNRPLPQSLRFLRPWRLDRVWAPVSLASLARGLWLVRSRGRAGLLPRGVRVTDLERGFRRWADIAATGPRTVLHGDPHPGNTYALPREVTGFYDWQLVRTGSWSHDVGYFMVSSLSVAERRAEERALLRAYLDGLGRRGVAAPDFDDAWSRYRQTPAYGLGAWLHTLSGGSFQPVEQCLAAIERFGAAYADHRSGQA